MAPYLSCLLFRSYLRPLRKCLSESSLVTRHSSLLLALLACGLSLQAQTASYSIHGVVRLPNGEAAPRVTVRITSQSGLDRQVFSDDMGRYEIRELPRGRYFLTVMNPQAPEQFTDPVEADTGRSFSGRVLVHLYLRKRVDAEPAKERTSAVISVVEATQHVPKPAQKAFEQAIKYRSEKKLEQAIQSLGKALDQYPAYFQAFAERGHIRIAMGQVSEAAEDFARALEFDPHYGPALRGSGMCRFQQGKYAEAVADLENAVAVEPANATSYLFLGIANLALDKREPARVSLQKALSLDPPGAARAHVHLANLYLKENRLQEAADELQTYLKAAPDAPDAQKLRAVEAQLRARLQKR